MSRVLPAAVCGTLASALAVGCGGGQPLDAHEARGNFTVAVTHASFPTHQAVSRPTRLVLAVHNTSARTLPNVTVGVTSFSYISNYPRLASRLRPVWVVDQGPGVVPHPAVETRQVDPPGSAVTSNYNIWALGPLKPGATKTFVWRVTPVKAGIHRVYYRVYAGLNGRARATLAGGGISAGSFTTLIAGRPPPTHVDPQTGKVVEGPYIPPEG
ncbi:MAG TPA: hypothetical protein VNY52_08865 [Solirubrobacteraceae bacterium]|jgi:hypothetical protein|nr:hypothetical protein [Solirubrobacteraceae bacterium]